MKYFSIKNAARVFVYTAPCHMAKSFRGLSELVKTELKKNVATGDLFLFLNKKRTYAKVLFFAEGGLCIFAKTMPEKLALDLQKSTLSLAELERGLIGKQGKKLKLAA